MNKVDTSVAKRSKKLGRKYAAEKNFGRAFCHYLVALTLKPEWKSVLEDEFIDVLCEWGLILEQNKKYADIFVSYKQASDIFPSNVIILNNFGAHLLRCHLLKEAAYYFEQCLRLKPDFIRASRNLDNLMNLAVERWHFRMLNDHHRNHSFRKAILKKIQQGFDVVLDIGTGTGLLSLFCFEGKAKEVYACDSSEVMIEIASKVFTSNSATDIKLLNKHSTELLIPYDIPRRVSLVVTEIFDSGLLGEGVLSTLHHAWKNLLLPPKQSKNSRADVPGTLEEIGFVIPFAAEIYVSGIQSDSISRRFYTNVTKALSTEENDSGLYIVSDCEGYDTQDLKLIDFTYLTNIEKLFRISFNDPDSIEDILKGNTGGEVNLKCIENGRLDCFVLWFDLILDEDIVVNTGPFSKTSNAWEQAIFPLSENIFVKKNQGIPTKILYKEGKLCINSILDNPVMALKASEIVVKRMNDVDLLKALTQTREKLLNIYDRSIDIMDWSPFPVLGLTFLRARLNRFKDKLTCFVLSETDGNVVSALAKKYGLEDRVVIEVDSRIDNYFFYKEKFDLIFLDFIEATGEIKEKCVSGLKQLRKLLKPNGIILPEEVTIVGQFVNCNWFAQNSRVLNNQRTCSFNVGKFINSYQVRHFIDFDAGIDKIEVSHPMDLFSISENEISVELEVPCYSNSSCINSMIYWFKIKFIKDSEEVFTNKKTSAFNLSAFLFPDIKFGESDKLKCRVLAFDGLFNVQLFINDNIVNDR